MSSPATHDRFTERARQVLRLAEEEAQRCNHEYVGPEHILLGMVREGSGVAANVLRNLDINLRRIRLEVELLVRSDPEPLFVARLSRSPRATQVVEYALAEAMDLNHHYVGTEHLLLGLLREEEGAAAQVLVNLGLRLQDVQEEVLNLLGHNGASAGTSTGLRRTCQDLPEGFQRDMRELDAHAQRLNEGKEAAVAEMDFERAAGLRHDADQLKRRKDAALRQWLARYPLEPLWLAWNGGTVVKLARAIQEEARWQDLPILADALEDAGCSDEEILTHCRQPGEHFVKCWVLDLLLSRA
jgi:Clp amino terminal domain, pathogenicity island component